MRICHACGVVSDAPYDVDPEAVLAVIDATAARTGLTGAAVTRGRSAPATRARAVAAAVLRRRLGLTYPELATIFHRDHTTMVHAVTVHDPGLAATVMADLDQQVTA